jgi:YD repeat-containing protein
LSATSAGIAASAAALQASAGSVPGPAGGSAAHGRHKKDPLYVLDAVNGIVATNNVVISGPIEVNQAFASQTMDLRGQEIGKTVSSYSWDLTNAPDVNSSTVTGQTTYRLQFSWNNITTNSIDKIKLTTTNSDSSTDSATATFLVNGTTLPITIPTWPSVLTPDALAADQETVDSQYSSADVATGALDIAHGLPAYNPGVSPLTLAYRSTATDRMPIFIAHYDIGSTVPTNVTAQLQLTDRNNTSVFNGSTYTYGTSSAQVNGGAILEIALQATGIASLNTDRYAYQITITGGPGANLTGQVSLVNSSAGIQNILGNGWSVARLEHLWPISAGGPITAGAIVDLGTGLSLWYPSNGMGGFLAPQPNDFSTLTLASGVYTRTLKDGSKYKFDSTTGRETSVIDRNNNTLTYTYDANGKLLYMTDFNNQVTTLSYSGSKVSSITDPASRIMSLAYDGSGRLNQITDPTPGGSAATPVTTFVYDASVDRILRIQDPDGNTTTFSYNSAGRLQTINRPQSVTEQLTAVQMAGLAGAVALAAQGQATFTDGNGHAWQTYLDWLGYGRSTQQIDPLNNQSLGYRDSNALTWLIDDPLGLATGTTTLTG